MMASRRQFLHFGAGSLAAASWGIPVRAATEVAPLRIAFALNRGPYDASNAPFLLAKARGYFREENIDIDFSLSKDAHDALHRVVGNEFDAGFLDLPVLLKFALDKPDEAPLYVFTVFDRSPASVVTWKTSGVMKPADLAGKTLAAVETDGAFQLFPIFLRAAGINPASVKLKMVTLAERENVMLRREADGAIGFDSTIVYKLAAGGAVPGDVDITYYSSGGLDLYSNGIIVSRKFLGSHSDRIAGMVRACAKGWRDALKDPKAAVEAIAALSPSIDQAKEMQRFEWIRTHQIVTPEVARNGLGLVDQRRLEATIRQILAYEGGRAHLRADQIYSPAYLPAKADRAVD